MNKEEKKLTDKEKALCWNYVFDPKTRWNKTQCAIKAGYSEHSAKEIAYEIFTKPHIKKEIDRLIDILQESEKELIRKVTEERIKLAFSNTMDFVDEEGNIKDLSNVDTSAIKKIKKNTLKKDGEIIDVEYQVELHDKTRNLEGLASYLGMDKKIIDFDSDLKIDITIKDGGSGKE
jgi:phage terminase small subunit